MVVWNPWERCVTVDDAANPNLPVVVVVLFPISFPTTARLLNDFSNAPIAPPPPTDDALEDDVLIIVAELIARRIASGRVPDFMAAYGAEVRAPKIMIPFETFWDYWHEMECVGGVGSPIESFPHSGTAAAQLARIPSGEPTPPTHSISCQ